MKSTKRKRIRWWMILLGIIVLLILIVTGYVLYVIISYYRIDDRQSLDMEGKSKSDVFMLDKEYTVMIYNIGFGAYTQDFTFFMDGGTQSWAKSKESVIDCIRRWILIRQEVIMWMKRAGYAVPFPICRIRLRSIIIRRFCSIR